MRSVDLRIAAALAAAVLVSCGDDVDFPPDGGDIGGDELGTSAAPDSTSASSVSPTTTTTTGGDGVTASSAAPTTGTTGDSSGAPQTGDDTGGGGSCEPQAQEGACLMCAVPNCCQAWTACQANAPCACVVQCHVLGGASLGSCKSQCDADGELYQALFFCGQQTCLGTCDWDCC